MMTEATVMTYMTTLAIATVVGFLTGIFGTGGSFLITPAMMIFVGVPAEMAVGNSLVAIIAASSFSLISRRKTSTVDTKLGLTVASGSVLGVIIGIAILQKLKQIPPIELFGREHVAIAYILLWLFIILLSIILFVIYSDLAKKVAGVDNTPAVFTKIPIPPKVHFATLEDQRASLPCVILFGTAVGVMTATLGVGGGVIMLPALMYLFGQTPKEAAGTSLLIVWCCSIIAGFGHIYNGNINLSIVIFLIIGSLCEANLGTVVGLKIKAERMKFYFMFVIIAALALVSFKIYDLTF